MHKNICKDSDDIEIRLADIDDIPGILPIYDSARQYMYREGNLNQWSKGYPWEWMLLEHIKYKELYVITKGGQLHAVFAFIIASEYVHGWDSDGNRVNYINYGTIHRLASDGLIRGVFKLCMKFCLSKIGSIRIDTHPDNKTMLRLIREFGFTDRGLIYVADGESQASPRLAFEYPEPEKFTILRVDHGKYDEAKIE